MGSDAPDIARFSRLLDGEAYGLAWRYACRLEESRPEAEDLLHDALAHAMLRLGQLKEEHAFSGWLLSIVRTRYLMAMRARRRRERAEARRRDAARDEGRPGLEGEAAGGAPWNIETGEGALSASLAAALCALPREQRVLLSLHYLEGMEADELARVYRVSRGAVEQRLHRARQALKRQLCGAGAPCCGPAPEEGIR